MTFFALHVPLSPVTTIFTRNTANSTGFAKLVVGLLVIACFAKVAFTSLVVQFSELFLRDVCLFFRETSVNTGRAHNQLTSVCNILQKA